MQIAAIKAKIVFDSRRKETVEAEIKLIDGMRGTASVPSGASTGEHEAAIIPAREAVDLINHTIAADLIGSDFDQASLDAKLRLSPGANTRLALSLSFARAAAFSKGLPLYRYFSSLCAPSRSSLPIPLFNLLNGGKHAAWSADIQEFMIVPRGAKSARESLHWAKKIFFALGEVLREKNLETELGDEGGYAPKLENNGQGLELLIKAVEKAGLEPGREIALALDVAASELWARGNYNLRLENKKLTSDEMIDWLENLINQYPIILLEDGLGENDWPGWKKLTARLGQKINLAGDDLFATNPARIKKGIAEKAASGVIIKPNQIGTVTETLEAVKTARAGGGKIIVSHRSGETLDDIIADLAVGVGADYLKAGSPSRPERLVKYDRLIKIEEEWRAQRL